MRLHPRGDLRRVVRSRRAPPPKPPPKPPAAAGDEVVDLALRDVLLELGQGRRGVGAVEAADGHDGLTAAQLVAGGVVRVHRGGRPGVLAGVGLQRLVQCGVGLAGVQEPRAARTGSTEPAGAAERPGSADGSRPPRAGARSREATAPVAGEAAGGSHRPATGEAAARRPHRGSRRRRRPGGAPAPGEPAGTAAGSRHRGPPKPPDAVGVTDGMAPVCGVAAVATVEKSGAASAAPRPSVATSADGQLRDGAASSGSARMATTPSVPDHGHEGPQRREPVGGAPEEDVAPDDRGGEARGQADAPDPGGPALPQAHGADADEGAERWRQRHRVVGVDDPLGQADDEADAHQRAAPEQEPGALAIGAAGPDGDDEQHGAHDEGARAAATTSCSRTPR